jgi:hypothetical protein
MASCVLFSLPCSAGRRRRVDFAAVDTLFTPATLGALPADLNDASEGNAPGRLLCGAVLDRVDAFDLDAVALEEALDAGILGG